MILNYDYKLWKFLRHEVLEIDLVNDMNMKLCWGKMIMEIILRIKDRLFDYEELVLILSKIFLINSISLKICRILFLMNFMVVFDHDRFY